MLALYTSRRSMLSPSGRDLAAYLKSTGFKKIELEYRITPEMYTKLVSEMKTSDLKAVSIHNYFPAPKVTPRPGSELWSLSAEEDDERNTAVAYTKQAINIAGELGAESVVLHCGRVPMASRYSELKAVHENGRINSPAGRRLIGELKIEREKKAGRTLERVRGCLEELANFAEKAGVKIGLENRYYVEEIPNIEEMSFLLDAVKSEFVGHWHDVGHAVVQENLGLEEHVSWLGRFRDKMIGVHLHDVRNCEDHLPPGTGEVDFAFIAENLPPGAIKVLKLKPGTTKTQLSAGSAHLNEAGIN